MVKTRGVLRLSANPLLCEWRVIFDKSWVALLALKKAPQRVLRNLFGLTIGDAAALLRAPFLGFIAGRFLRLGKEVDLLGDDLAAVTVGAILIGPFGVMDTPGDHDHCTLGNMLGDAFADAIETSDPVPLRLGLAVTFAILEAAGGGERYGGDRRA